MDYLVYAVGHWGPGPIHNMQFIVLLRHFSFMYVLFA